MTTQQLTTEAKLAKLETSVVAAASSQDNNVPAAESHEHPDQIVDPQGRKPWDLEWRESESAMMIYVPANALIVDGSNVYVTATERIGDEVAVEAGSWYLHVYKDETTQAYEANLDDQATQSRSGKETLYNIRIADISTDGGFVEKQYVVGSIILGAVADGEDCKVDDVSIEEHNAAATGEPEELEHAIKGWHDQDAVANNSIADIMSATSDASGKQVVVRNDKGGALQYLPIGVAGKDVVMSNDQQVSLGKVVASGRIVIPTKQMAAGRGISIQVVNGVIIISSDAPTDSGDAIKIQNGVISAVPDSSILNPATKTLEVAGTSPDTFLRLFGSGDVTSHLLDSLSATLNGRTHSGQEYAVVVSGGLMKYKEIKPLNISAGNGSGLQFTDAADKESRTLDWAGRSQSQVIALHDLKLYAANGQETVVKFPSTGDAVVPIYVAGSGISITANGGVRTISLQGNGAITSIVAGIGITVSRVGNTVTISATGQESGGYSQDIPFVSSVTYSGHQIIAHKKVLKVSNGRITGVDNGTDETITAVPETV